MGAWTGKRKRPCPNLDHARSLDRSRSFNHGFFAEPVGLCNLAALGFNFGFGPNRKLGLLPGIEAADHVRNVSETSTLQQAARNHAAIATLAMDGNRTVAIDLRRRNFEVVQRPPDRAFDLSRLPFGFAAYVEHLGRLQAIAQSLHIDLRKICEREACLFPS